MAGRLRELAISAAVSDLYFFPLQEWIPDSSQTLYVITRNLASRISPV